jgi:hypothetical protein
MASLSIGRKNSVNNSGFQVADVGSIKSDTSIGGFSFRQASGRSM